MTTTVRIGRRARRSVAAAAGVALIGGLGFGLAAPVASASPADDKVCGPLDSGKRDTTGDPEFVRVEAPAGKLISAYCVKAGSANQGDGPVTTTLPTPVAVYEIRSATGKAVSHWSVSYVDAPGQGATETTTVSASPTLSPTGSGTPSEEPSESVTPTETASQSPTVTTSASVTPSEDPSEGTPTESASASPSVSPTDPAAACLGLGDDEDYRSLFTYEYFAAGESGWVSLGSTLDWDDEVFVQYLNGYSTDPIENMMVRAVVTLGADVDIAAGCEYEFSLASYETEGPTFGTSGEQVFLDHDTDTITEGTTTITLEVEPAVCFGQSDLYTGSDVYDGDRTPRGPGYAPITVDGNMIANWGGGYGCDDEPTGTPTPGTTAPTDGPSDTPSEDPSDTPSDTPSETVPVTPSGSPSPGVTVTPSDSPSVTVTPSESLSPGSGTTTTSTSTTTTTTSTSTTSLAAAATGTTPAVRGAVTQRPSAALARTGTEAWTVALVAGVLLVAGGAMTALAQGSSRGRRH